LEELKNVILDELSKNEIVARTVKELLEVSPPVPTEEEATSAVN
jgi:hypothetical protein